mmetsp:Transcript_98325/g.175072  ORF Transcript_98325/g.175072 Transcript_98325/m.175072 type:complete len:1328 (+) Transcript_98325:88-4071(+)|eukprot:CAMPEP_0197630514 /NCGR_PEP_ID=MMETSP1338-20131121/7972_1 /TAXON_ID=43686 ORGANISM="Pelagodinium beii, Strain RCC1491" /NCGR_SAMPLE_ID=MMETSP1338 /ASSEMBLY_ACC=CAM_ASM_000754 /LENGTH=1327 /DNA_ID=CAMNT_0043201747 /DNA_START=76 /DNA_END=4059 /DNA_ORIENTATION=+
MKSLYWLVLSSAFAGILAYRMDGRDVHHNRSADVETGRVQRAIDTIRNGAATASRGQQRGGPSMKRKGHEATSKDDDGPLMKRKRREATSDDVTKRTTAKPAPTKPIFNKQEIHCFDKEYRVTVRKSSAERENIVSITAEQVADTIHISSVWSWKKSQLLGIFGTSSAKECQVDYKLTCEMPAPKKENGAPGSYSVFSGWMKKFTVADVKPEDEPHAAILVDTLCGTEKSQQIMNINKGKGTRLPLGRGNGFVSLEPGAEDFGEMAKADDGSYILVETIPWKSKDILALKTELDECKGGASISELEFKHLMDQKDKLESKQEALLNSDYEELRLSVVDLRGEVAESEKRIQDLKLQKDAKAIPKLQDVVAILEHYVRNFEEGKSPPNTDDETDSSGSDDDDQRPENEHWPPLAAEAPVSEDADAMTDLKQEIKKLRQRTMLMQRMVFALQEAKEQLTKRLQAANVLAEELKPQANSLSAGEKAVKLKKQIEGLKKSIQKEFPQSLFRIRKLSLLAERGGQVTTLLTQIRQTLQDDDKKQRFEEFARIGLVDKDRLMGDFHLEQSVKEALKISDMSQCWSKLKKLTQEAMHHWETSLGKCQGSEHCVLPKFSAEFTKQEESLSMLVPLWLRNAEGGGPLSFDEEILEAYLNWVEDLNGAVRVYVKVTNRENKSAGYGISNAVQACASKSSDYVPDRKVRLLSCDKEPPTSTNLCSTLTGPDGDESVPNSQAYGPFYGIFSSPDAPQQNLDITANPKNEDLYNSDLNWAPGLKTVLRQVKSGYTVVLFGYGYSGSGKTYTLLGNAKTRGVVTIGLESLGSDLEVVNVRMKELYGKMKLEDGRPLSGESGVYSYKLKLDEAGQLETNNCKEGASPVVDEDGSAKQCLETSFWGRHPAKRRNEEEEEYPPEFGLDVSEKDFQGFMQTDSVPIPGQQISSFLNRAFRVVSNTRVHAKCRTSKDQDCPRIRATPNNPESSRGHLFTILDVKMKGSSEMGSIVVVDMAGAENPLAIAKDNLDFSTSGMSEMQINDFLGQKLRIFDKTFEGGKRLRLWQTQETQARNINLHNAEKFLGDRVDQLSDKDPQKKDKILQWWTDEKVKKTLIPMVQEGVFINEGLNHLRQFLLWRGNKLKQVTEGIENASTFAWDNDGADVYRPEKFVQPAQKLRVARLHEVGDGKRIESTGLYTTVDLDAPRVPLIMSGACVVEWDENCRKLPVDGFVKDVRLAERTLQFTDSSGTLAENNLKEGDMSKLDPMMMLSMLHYFDHPEAFGPMGKLNSMKRPTKFIMLAAVRREHPLQASQAEEAHKLNICRGTEATLKFTASLNPLSN